MTRQSFCEPLCANAICMAGPFPGGKSCHKPRDPLPSTLACSHYGRKSPTVGHILNLSVKVNNALCGWKGSVVWSWKGGELMVFISCDDLNMLGSQEVLLLGDIAL